MSLTLYVGLLSNNLIKNIKNIENLQNNNSKIVIISKLKIEELSTDDIKQLMGTNVAFLPNVNDYKFAAKFFKNKKYTAISSWILNQPKYTQILMNNGINYLVTNLTIPSECKNLNDLKISYVPRWERQYKGKFGYVISCHDSDDEIIHYPYASSINHKSDGLYVQQVDESSINKIIKL